MRTKIFFFLSIGLIISSMSLLSASISGDVYVAGVSKYLWRGQMLYNKFALQPGLDLNYDNFSVGFWGSYNASDSEFGEADLLAAYSYSISLVEMKAGFTYYTFPNISDTSIEASLGASLKTFLSPSITTYYDFGSGDGTYIEGAVSLPFTVLIPFSLDVSTGYNFGQWGYNSSLTVLGIRLGATYSIGSFEIRPSLFGQLKLNDQYSNDLFGSLNIQYNF